MQKTNSFQFPWPHILESYPIIRPAFICVTWERASPEARVSFEGSARDWLSDSPPPFLGLAHVGVVLLIDKRHWHMGCLLWSSGWRWAELHCSGAKCYVCGRGVEDDACGWVLCVWGCQGMGGYFDWFVSWEPCFCFLWKQVVHEQALICFPVDSHRFCHNCDGNVMHCHLITSLF